MYPKASSTPGKRDSLSISAELRQYTPPVFRHNRAGSYVEFYAYDPALGRNRRKVIKLNRCGSVAEARRASKEIILRLTEKLCSGWNPWVSHSSGDLETVSSVFDRYSSYLDKMFSDGLYRQETYVGYKSYLKILGEYISLNPITYLYQLDRRYLSSFLDWIFVDRGNSAQTRNNYLNFLRVLCGHLLSKGLITSKPTDGILPISRKLIKKTRTPLSPSHIKSLSSHLKTADPHFLLACYLLYYCFIRPVEMTRLHVGDIDVRTSTITLRSDQTKNRKKQTVTVPKKVLHYMLDLDIFSHPSSDYLFSGLSLSPGRTPIDTKQFRDHWGKVRKSLGFPKSYQFYSLKDTGITEMCDRNLATIDIRDQARHSSLSITDIYTRHSGEAKDSILSYDGTL